MAINNHKEVSGASSTNKEDKPRALLASGYTQGNYEQARQVICRVLQIGLVTGIALAVILFVGFGAFSSLFSTDLEVLKIAWSGILVRTFKSEALNNWAGLVGKMWD
ncbi:MATE efflux family protein 2, chloroplastic [Morella rubra]|uniref:MATE efflux family protein 2, chloroplastic n=1 Tax=Morella rubra TaxID=262757 RepID=A0A6A1UJD6_9ROSI|nr:MATE efflux family protein 2, chloroplastic [Morella rubra]